MDNPITLVQIFLGLALIGLILLQPKGSGLSASSNWGQSFTSKKGVEKYIFWLTIIVVVLFLIIAVGNLIW